MKESKQKARKERDQMEKELYKTKQEVILYAYIGLFFIQFVTGSSITKKILGKVVLHMH